MNQDKKIGLVLSGGGVRGVAHLGAIKALEAHGIFPEVISGTSAGSIAGAMYAHGYTPDEAVKILKEIPYIRSLRAGIWSMGLISNRALYNVLVKYITNNDFSLLKKKLFVCIANLRTGKPTFVNEGEVALAITASSAVPVLMSPVEINGELYCDGGVVNNFPIEPLERDCNLIFGISVNPVVDNPKINSTRRVGERAFMLAIHEHSKPRMARCDWLIEPRELGGFGLLDVKKIEEVFNIGYDAAMRKLEEHNPLKSV